MSTTPLRRTVTIARTLLGLIFLVFGLNGFLQFLPMPQQPPAAAAFMGGLAAAGYFFPLLKGTEVVVGALLLSGRFVPLALTVLAPITINILAVHVFLSPGIGMALLITTLHLGLAWAYRDAFRSMLAADAKPAAASESRPVTVAATA